MTRLSRFGKWLLTCADTVLIPLLSLACIGVGATAAWGWQIGLIVVGSIVWLDCTLHSLVH